jgi:hypothetical protein
VFFAPSKEFHYMTLRFAIGAALIGGLTFLFGPTALDAATCTGPTRVGHAAPVPRARAARRNARAGQGETDTVHRLRWWDKPKALELAAKLSGVYVEKKFDCGAVVPCVWHSIRT